MTPAQLFAAVGTTLYGDHFKAPLAKALNLSVDRVDDWSKGRGNGPPQGVWLEMAGLLQDRERLLPMLKVDVLHIAEATTIECSFTELRTSGHVPMTDESMLAALRSKFETLLRNHNIKSGYIFAGPASYTMVLAYQMDEQNAQALKNWLGKTLDDLRMQAAHYPTSAEGMFTVDTMDRRDGFQRVVTDRPRRR